MSTQLPVNTKLILHTWDQIARDSCFKPDRDSTGQSLVLYGSGKWVSQKNYVGLANVKICFWTRLYEMFLKEISVEFIPDHPETSGNSLMLEGKTLMAFYHQRLITDLRTGNIHNQFVATCPQSLVVLLGRHNFVSSLEGYPVMFTALQGKTIAE